MIIHKVDRKGTNYYSTILTHSADYDEMVAGTEWVYFFQQDDPKLFPSIKVRFERIDKERQVAVLQINSTFNTVNYFTHELLAFPLVIHYNNENCWEQQIFERLFCIFKAVSVKVLLFWEHFRCCVEAEKGTRMQQVIQMEERAIRFRLVMIPPKFRNMNKMSVFNKLINLYHYF